MKNTQFNFESESEKVKFIRAVSIETRAPEKESKVFKKHHLKKLSTPIGTKKDTFFDTKQDIRRFYEKDDNSMPAPGAREFMTRNKNRMRKRYLADTIVNLYKKYCAQSEKKILEPFSIDCGHSGSFARDCQDVILAYVRIIRIFNF